MDLASLLLPKSSLSSLRCAFCKNYLSYFPIRVCSDNKNICGRCVTSEDHIYQNVAYETLVELLQFPCRYESEGCIEKLQPRNIPEHEKNCVFRIVSCPIQKNCNCDWQGNRQQVFEHCLNLHNNMFLKTKEISISSSTDSNIFFLIDHNNMLLFCKLNFISARKLIQFEIYSGDFELNLNKYLCQLYAKCDNKTISMDFTSTTFNEMITNDLNLESIINGGSFTIRFTIGETLTDHLQATNSEVLAILKCCDCGDYSIPPIYCCLKTSSTLCSNCKFRHHSTCNSCLTGSSTRNINLDRIASLLNYPCKNHINGCNVVDKPDLIKNHQKICDLGNFQCPLSEFENCTWTGLWQTIEDHIQNNHQDLVTNSTQITKQFLPQRMKYDIIKFSKQLFRLVALKTADETYFWTVHSLGPYKRDFKYEIEVIGNSGNRLLASQQCGPLLNKEQLFKQSDNFCYFTKNQMRDFVNQQVITFKVHIFI